MGTLECAPRRGSLHRTATDGPMPRSPSSDAPTIFFSVGEPSGDVHGANLIRALRERCPRVEVVGYGGPRMAEAGCDLHADLTALAVMWFLHALLNIHKFW